MIEDLGVSPAGGKATPYSEILRWVEDLGVSPAYIYVYIYIYMCVCERVYIMRIESPALNVFLCHDTAAIHTCG